MDYPILVGTWHDVDVQLNERMYFVAQIDEEHQVIALSFQDIRDRIDATKLALAKAVKVSLDVLYPGSGGKHYRGTITGLNLGTGRPTGLKDASTYGNVYPYSKAVLDLIEEQRALRLNFEAKTKELEQYAIKTSYSNRKWPDEYETDMNRMRYDYIQKLDLLKARETPAQKSRSDA